MCVCEGGVFSRRRREGVVLQVPRDDEVPLVPRGGYH